MAEAEVLQNEGNVMQADTVKRKKKGIPGSTIKMIAIITMLIDHIGAAILEKMLLGYGLDKIETQEEMMLFMKAHAGLYYSDMLLRLIGRIAFPLFCFLLVEGVIHTSNRLKYAIRLAVFAIISEIPFDLAFNSKLFDWGYQNVFFTLAIGVGVLCALEKMQDFYQQGALAFFPQWAQRATLALADLFLLATGMGMAALMKTDYGSWGVLCITLIYVFRKRRILSIGVGCFSLVLMSFSEITCPIAMVPVAMYNGERGLKLKYFFYIFYPAHLLLLALIGKIMGIF
ncbi:MAG: TraX family protein [Clostridiales bacterium]|nr:TraX family protein [Clostridiales bacterium]